MLLKWLVKKEDLLDDSPGTWVLATDKSGHAADADDGDRGGPCKAVCRDDAKRVAMSELPQVDYSRFLVRCGSVGITSKPSESERKILRWAEGGGRILEYSV